MRDRIRQMLQHFFAPAQTPGARARRPLRPEKNRCILTLDELESRLAPAVTTNGTAADFHVTIDAADNVSVGITATAKLRVTANGVDLPIQQAASSIIRLTITAVGDFANTIDLTGMSPADFVQLTQVNVFAGGGNDTLLGSPFANAIESLDGGDGDDLLAVRNAGFASIHGGGGSDAVRLDGPGLTLDLTDPIVNSRLRTVETIDLSGPGAHTLRLNAQAVHDVSGPAHTLVVKINPGDTFSKGIDWTAASKATIDGAQFTVYTQGDATLKVNDNASLTPLTVTSLADNLLPDGLVTLREAIQAANTDTTVDGVTGSGDDVIRFAPGLTGTIHLTGALPELSSNLEIRAPGANLLTVRRDSGGDYRIFLVSAGATVGIAGLTITNGNLSGFVSGAGVRNQGTLTLARSTVAGNATGGSGGGIFNDGNLTVADSTISGNSAQFGGGISSSGTLRLNNSTISNNSASNLGGGIDTFGGSTLTIANTTVSGNQANGNGGGLSLDGGSATFTNVTIAHNRADVDSNGGDGGGLAAVNSTLTLHNTIVAHNLRTSIIKSDITGTVAAASMNNLIGEGGAGGLVNGNNGNQVGVANASLGPLQDNGGPTFTHALIADSPAIDKGDNAKSFALQLFEDQRRAFRSVDGPDADNTATVDVGAFEFGTFFVNTLLDLGDTTQPGDGRVDGDAGTPGDQVGLRGALHETNALAGRQFIQFSVTGTITLVNGQLVVNDDLDIIGPGASSLTISGNKASRVLQVEAGKTLSLESLTVAGGRVNGQNGGGIRNLGTLFLENCVVADNAATGSRGGGIANEGTLEIYTSTLSGNSSSSGGGVFSSGTLYMFGSTLADNSAFQGGALATSSSVVNAVATIDASTISANSADQGGGIFHHGVLDVRNSTLSGNFARFTGAALYFFGGQNADSTLTNVTITNNRADSDGNGTGSGGGVYVTASRLALNNTIVAANFKGPSPSTVPDDMGGLGNAKVDADRSFNNLVGPGGGGGLSDGVNDNQVGVSNPRLGPLQNNGGSTFTHALLPGSPALDRGSTFAAAQKGLSTDQRAMGFVRAADAADADNLRTVDIGAFEAQPSLEDISDKSTAEDVPLTITFAVADTALGAVNVSATSSNAALVPDANLLLGGIGQERTLQITPAKDQHGQTMITVTVSILVGTQTISMSDSFVLTVDPVNDAPVNILPPPPQKTKVNTMLIFTAARRISISDVDAVAGIVRVTLTARQGTLALGTTAGLASVKGNGSAKVIVTGTITAINNALNRLKFKPLAGFRGKARLTSFTQDLGNSGLGGAKSDTDSLVISVV
jgi:CSLREA domain-containing protein